MAAVTLDGYLRMLLRLARLGSRDAAGMAAILGDLGISAEDLQRDEPVVLQQLAQVRPMRQTGTAMNLVAVLSDELTKLGPLELPRAAWAPGNVAAFPSAYLPSIWVAESAELAAEPDPPQPARAGPSPWTRSARVAGER